MREIVLIACVSKKGDKKAKAKDLYLSPLFRNSLEYAETLKPDKIFILSALYHLLELDTEIEPYNVTLSNVSKTKRKPGLKVLNSTEKKEWGKKVIEMLSAQADLERDRFIILAGQEYIKPIKDNLHNYDDVLKGVSLFDRVPLLKQKINGNRNTQAF
jgi:cytoplasmic iron level regulating protein YaaA (DUF328/UPF0246 family)